MTYHIKAAAQGEAERLAIEKARRDGCESVSVHIVEVTVALTPDANKQQNTQPAPAPVIIVNPTPVPQTSDTQPPRIEYQEAYQAGYDHGITGFLTGRNAGVLNSEIPEKYRVAEQEQAYKNGYARGFADEKTKAEQAQATKHQQLQRGKNPLKDMEIYKVSYRWLRTMFFFV
jgi:hypothetical protein